MLDFKYVGLRVFKQNRLEIGGRPVSITMPFSNNPYECKNLFPVFINLLSEGSNKKMQCRLLKIAEDDYFSLLLATANVDYQYRLIVSFGKDEKTYWLSPNQLRDPECATRRNGPDKCHFYGPL